MKPKVVFSIYILAFMLHSCNSEKRVIEEIPVDFEVDTILVKKGERAVVIKNYSSGLDKDNVLTPGYHSIAQGDVLVRYDVKEQRAEHAMDVLDRNGLSLWVDVTIIFNPIYDRIGYLHEKVGHNYVSIMLIPVVRSSVRAVSGHYTAEEIYSAKRTEVESEIINAARKALSSRDIDMKGLQIKSIKLPDKTKKAIKLKQNYQHQSDSTVNDE